MNAITRAFLVQCVEQTADDFAWDLEWSFNQYSREDIERFNLGTYESLVALDDPKPSRLEIALDCVPAED